MMLDIIHKASGSHSIFSPAIGGAIKREKHFQERDSKHLSQMLKLFCSRWCECPPLQEVGLCPEILIIHIDKTNKMWERLNRCLGKRGT